MLIKIAILLGLLALFSSRSTHGSTLDAGPVNTAALVGTETELNCSATLTAQSPLKWSVLDATTSTYNAIYLSSDGNILDDKYSIDVGDGYYNLIIKSTDASVASKYGCELPLISNVVSYASVVAVEDVQCPDVGFEVVAGSDTLALCQVVFYSTIQDANLIPSLKWSTTGDNPAILESSLDFNSSHSWVEMNVTLEAVNDQQNFTCELSFVGDGAPTYTASCDTYFNVLHGVSEITIEPNITDGDSLEVGTVITCTSDGRPAPTIIWIDSNGNATYSENETLTVDDSMVGTDPVTFICQATNQVVNDTYTVEQAITFVAVPINIAPVVSSGVETWVIVVAVVVPVVVLTAAAITAFFVYRHYKKKEATKTKYSGNGNGSAAPTAATAAAAASRNSDPVENQPFLYRPNPQPAARSLNGDVNYQPNGQPARPGSTSGFADLGTAAPNGSGQVGGSQYDGSTSRIASPTPMNYPYVGPATTSLAGAGPGSVAGSQRGLPAMTAGVPAATYAPSTGRMTPANVSMQPNPISYPYSGPSRQLSNASSVSRGSSYHGGSQQMQPPPLSYPPARSAASSHNSSLV